MLRGFIYYWNIFAITLKNNFVNEFIYRTNFFAMTLADLVWIAIEASFFEIIYSNINSINGWTKPETFFFLGVFISSDTLFTIFFQRSFWQFPALINQGELDILLTKPANTVFLACFRYINLSQTSNLFLGFWIIHHYGPSAGFKGGLSWLTVGGWIMVGLVAQFLLRFGFLVWTFWLERGISTSMLYYQFYALANKPDGIYPKLFRFLIKTILPFAFIGSVPSQMILGKANPSDFAFLFLSLGTYALGCRFLWKRGLLRYQSASS